MWRSSVVSASCWQSFPTSTTYPLHWHGSLNVPMFHITQPWSVYGLFDGYYKVMSNIPKSWDSYQPLTGVKTLGTLGQMLFIWHNNEAPLLLILTLWHSTKNHQHNLKPSVSIQLYHIMLYECYMYILDHTCMKETHYLRVCRNTSWSGLMFFFCFYEKLKNMLSISHSHRRNL